MSRRGTKKEAEVKQAIRDYIKANGASSTRTIADCIEKNLGVRPGTNLIAAVLKDMGYKPVPSYWVKA